PGPPGSGVNDLALARGLGEAKQLLASVVEVALAASETDESCAALSLRLAGRLGGIDVGGDEPEPFATSASKLRGRNLSAEIAGVEPEPMQKVAGIIVGHVQERVMVVVV
ncbi:MAG: hypothetical protein M3O46_04855, partial [Myxococcota bacterium]|nr:hypothetical protein [Myxococcota bacterium]